MKKLLLILLTLSIFTQQPAQADMNSIAQTVTENIIANVVEGSFNTIVEYPREALLLAGAALTLAATIYAYNANENKLKLWKTHGFKWIFDNPSNPDYSALNQI